MTEETTGEKPPKKTRTKAAGSGMDGIRAVLSDAELALNATRSSDPPPHISRSFPNINSGEPIRPGEWPGYPSERLPPGCAVTPVGIEGKTAWFLDSLGQLVQINSSEWGHKVLWHLFAGSQNWVTWAWPRFGKTGINGTDANAAAACLVNAAAKLGVFDPSEKVRGRGAWTDRDGSLLWHAGARIWRAGGKHAPLGRIGGLIYPTRSPVAEPWAEPVTNETNPARSILEALRRWNWGRPDVDPVLMLGWIVAAFLGGALPWRPTVFVSGDKAVGKSTLQTLIKSCLGDALVQTADTTAAGIYQRIAQDALPIAVDELESDADNRRVMAVIKLARLAASGAQMLRGGADHSGTEFRAQSTFFFSSINRPPLAPQDLSRMALLSLMPVEDHASDPPVIDPEVTPRLLIRWLLDQWNRFPECFALYRSSLRKGGHGGRGQDTYGILLACADLALGPDLIKEMHVPLGPDDDQFWAINLATGELQEYEDAAENWRACATHLLTARVDVWRAGQRHTVGGILEDLIEKITSETEANRLLAQTGLRAVPDETVAGKFLLAVPNQSQLVAELFRGTVWAGAPGAAVWASALRQGPASAVIADKARNKIRINGVQVRCTLLVVAETMKGA